MNNSRRSFMKATAATASATAAALSCTRSDSAVPQDDPSVSKRLGPHGVARPITVAGYRYGRVQALIDGDITVNGFSTRFEVTSIGPLNNHAFFGPQSRDVTEIGLIPFILAYANGGFRDYKLLPIPVLRLFRHKSIFVRTDRGIETPADLKGRKVATVGYSSSGLTHVRGILEEEYGVKPSEIEWISTKKDSAANQTGNASSWEKVRPEGISITDAPADEDDSSLLLAGKVDAIFHPAEPKVFQDRNPIVKRLFTDHRTVERDFFKRTGIFPIMHSIAIRKKSVEDYASLPKEVFEAYSRAKTLDYDNMRQWGWVQDSLPWYGQELEETQQLMGDNFYTYGLKACAPSYEMAIRFLHDQGLSKRKPNLEELFESSSLAFEEPS